MMPSRSGEENYLMDELKILCSSKRMSRMATQKGTCKASTSAHKDSDDPSQDQVLHRTTIHSRVLDWENKGAQCAYSSPV